MALAEEFTELVRACFTGVWIQSHEHSDALVELAQVCRQENWQLASWNAASGLCGLEAGERQPENVDPLAALRALDALATPDGAGILILENFHRFLGSAEIVQTVAQQILRGRHNRTFVVVLSPVVEIPKELEKLFVVLHHPLPDREQLREIAQGIAVEIGELPEGAQFERVLDAAAGLSRFEAEGAFSLSVVRELCIQPEIVWSIKAQQLEKDRLLTLHWGDESFETLGGLDALKRFCLRAMRKQGTSIPLVRPRGVMLLSPPGCGKSQFAKSLGRETGRPTLVLDIGALMGSLVGSTESNVRRALQMIDAMAPAVVLIDEVEKALAGVSSSGQTDSGVTARLFGALLSWMNDRTSDVFLVTTCNDISKLPPEFARAERFDAIWYVDLPSDSEKQAIWQIYLNVFQLDPNHPRPNDNSWSGAVCLM